ncbi:MAG TPA: prohibitin family protein, partial [Chthonomonadaceae bacterium]|nr:prohibitin family protein [Chthonomonadaceae bacterium]
GKDYISKIIRPEVRSHTRIAVAEFPAEKVYSTERRTIEANIESRLREKLARNYVLVDEVLLRKVSFSDAFQSAIIQKQIAQQNAQRMQYVLEKQQREKQRQIILAEGEAEAIRLKGQAIATNPNVLAYEYVQKVAPNIRGIITNGGSVPMPTVQAARK